MQRPLGGGLYIYARTETVEVDPVFPRPKNPPTKHMTGQRDQLKIALFHWYGGQVNSTFFNKLYIKTKRMNSA